MIALNSTSALSHNAGVSGESTERPWFVYILRCADQSLYTGSSPDLERRLAAHNAGNGAKYTRARRPVTLLYQERYDSRSLAARREWEIKQLSRKDKLLLISNSYE